MLYCVCRLLNKFNCFAFVLILGVGSLCATDIPVSFMNSGLLDASNFVHSGLFGAALVPIVGLYGCCVIIDYSGGLWSVKNMSKEVQMKLLYGSAFTAGVGLQLYSYCLVCCVNL